MKNILLLLIVICSIGKASAQEDKFKALFIYNFTKYVDWPSKDKEFVIGVLGASLVENELSLIAGKRTVGDKKIIIKKFDALSDVSNCQMLYIPSARSKYISTAVLQQCGRNTLIITDKSNVSDGAAINFVKINGAMKFEVSQNNIKKCGLLVNTELLKLGIPKD